MAKCLVYMRGGLGDMYPFLTMKPELFKEYGLSEEDLTYWIDSVYFNATDRNPSYALNLDSMRKLFELTNVKEFNLVPNESTSAWDLIFHCNECHKFGPHHHSQDKEFMFGRNQVTKEFIMDKLREGEFDYFVDVAIPEHVYLWKAGEEEPKPIKLNYLRKQIAYQISQEEKNKIDELLKTKHIVVQYGMRGANETKAYANSINSFLTSQGYKVLMMGFDYGLVPYDNLINLTNGRLSFEGYLYLVDNADKALLYSSFFAFHRMYKGDKKTISYWARHLGSWEKYLYDQCLKNPNNIFIDSDEFALNVVIDNI
jgi:hypothetical protein